MATPATRRDSCALAEEAAERDAYGMDVDYESPTPRPQQNEEMLQIMQQMQQQLNEQESRYQAKIAELEQQVRGSNNNQQPSNASSDLSIADLVKWFKSNSTHDPVEKEESRIIRGSERYWRDHGFKLAGRENFALWQQAILRDAEYIDARDLLEKGAPESSNNDPVETAGLATKNRLLETRILSMLPLNIQQQVYTDRIQSPHILWQKLNAIYGLSPAEERLLTIKTMINLQPQSNPIAMMRQWEDLVSRIKEKAYSVTDICHDIGIILLGDWQKTYVRGALDDFFALSKEGKVHRLDMHKLIEKLEVRSKTNNGQYNPLSYPFYHQEPRAIPKGGEEAQKAGKQAPKQPGSQASIKETERDDSLCPYCRRGHHAENDCWIKHPEKRPPPRVLAARRTTREVKPNEVHGSASFISNGSGWGTWILDTAASWHVCSKKSAFDRYIDLNHYSDVELPDGSKQQVYGVGTINLPVGDSSVELQNVRYIPQVQAQLVSFGQLAESGFRIQLTKKPYKFILTSPKGIIFEAQEQNSIYIIQPYKASGIANAVGKLPDTADSEDGADSEDSNGNKSRLKTQPPTGSSATIDQWHHRLSHMNQHDLQYLHRIGRIQIQGKKLLTPCDYCFKAKMTRKIGNGPTPRSTRPAARLHVDLFGGGRTLGLETDDEAPPANGKFKYVLLITDDATRLRWVFPLINRDNPVHTIMGHIDWLRNLGFAPAYIRGDNEFFRTPGIWQKKGIKPEPTVPHSPWQNGVDERGIRVILERSRAALYASGLPRRFWLEALMDTVNKTNHLPTSTPLFNDPKPDGNVLDQSIKKSAYYIPVEAWENRPLNIAYLRPFGATIWYHRHGTQKPSDKMDSRGGKGILVGQIASNISLAWTEDDKIQRVADGHIDDSEVRLSEGSTFTKQRHTPGTSETAKNSSMDEIINSHHGSHDSGVELRPARGFAAYTASSSPAEKIPRSYSDAMRRPDRNKWLAAMEREMEKLTNKNVWDLVRKEELPPGTRVYPGRWVFNIKDELDPDDPKYYKARWVIRGNLVDHRQMQYDYCTYAPVVMAATTRLLFALAARYGWTIRQADAVVAFLNGALRDTIYMNQPLGFAQGEKRTLVCKLNQSLYGLAPAARIWYDTLNSYLIHIGFRVCEYDAGLFIHTERQNVYLTTHVDDFKIVAADATDAEWVVTMLATRFEIKDMGEMRHYLGMDVNIHPDGIFLGQSTYIDELINSFGMETAHTHKTPLDSGLVIDDEPDEHVNKTEYQRGVGSLQWLASRTRPDIAHAASILAQYNSAPTKKCWNALMHVLRYLRGSRDHGVQYQQRNEGADSSLIGYTDSDWAGANTGRKSIGGYIFMLAGSPISWQAKKQTCVATSSNEAEYMAASEAAKEAHWLRRVYASICAGEDMESGPVPLYMDNQGAMALTTSEGTKRSKHIDIRFHHIRDLQQQGIIVTKGVESKQMAADGLTKILRTDAFNQFLSLIAMGSRGGDLNSAHNGQDG